MKYAPRRHGLLLLAVAFCCAPTQAANVLLVTRNNGSLTSGESDRQAQFVSLGHTVTTIWDDDSQANYDTAIATVDVAYIPVTVSSGDIGYKLRLAPIGVVYEEKLLDVEMGLSTSDGFEQNSTNQVYVTDNSHPVSSALATSYITIFSSTQPRSLMQGTYAGGRQTLATSASGSPALVVVDRDGALANTYNGNSTAVARRVRLPWGGESFNFSSLDSDGLSILQNAISWASGNLVLHWKLDEASGTTAADSSGSNVQYDGTVTGTATWDAAIRDNGLELDGSTHIETPGLLGEPDDFTVAAWVRLDAIGSLGSELISLGDHITLRLDEDSGNGASIYFYYYPYWERINTGVYLEGTGWRHVVATFDDSANTLRLYIDGELLATKTTTHSIEWSGLGSNTIIGKHGNGSTAWDLTGAVDDVRIYNYALTATEVAEVYGLIGHWTFDEGSGSSIADSSPKGADAIFSTGSPAWVSGVRGGALEFDGANDAATIAEFDPPATGSVAFWFRRQGGLTTGQRFFGSSTSWEATFKTDGSLTYDFGVGGGFSSDDKFTEADVWNHAVTTYNESTGAYALYINGQLSKSGTRSFTDEGPGILSFGKRTGSSAQFIGALDDVRVYNYEISEAKIAELHGLVGHWKLDETSGTTAVDSSLSANDGTFVNNPALGISAVEDLGASFNESDSNDYIDLPHTVIDGLSEISVAWWMRTEKTGTSSVLSGNRSGQDNAFLLYFLSHTAFRPYLNGSQQTYTIDSIAGGAWRHFVYRLDRAAGMESLHIDGVEAVAGFRSPTTDLLDIDAGGLLIAQEQDSVGGSFVASQVFDGVLDDIRIYNRVITLEEIDALSSDESTDLRITRWVETVNP